MARHPNEGKDELKEILYQKLYDHVLLYEIPHISIFIAENIDVALKYGYEAIRQFLYDNDEFSTLLKIGKHKRIAHLLRGILDGKINPASGIFALKQDGFSDKEQETKQPITINYGVRKDDKK